MSKSGFQFKHFFVAHDRCGMRVGTDGILLGAWAPITAKTRHILDIGCGTGLIALMLAQRLENIHRRATFQAIDIDYQATEQARYNIEQSPWGKQINVLHSDLDKFVKTCDQRFDLIVSNPPFFTTSITSPNHQRSVARHIRSSSEKENSDFSSSHFQWLQRSEQLLTETGRVCFILPTVEALQLCEQSKQTALYCLEKCAVITKEGKAAHRYLLCFGHETQDTIESELRVYDENNQYHSDYKMLAKDFYLNF